MPFGLSQFDLEQLLRGAGTTLLNTPLIGGQSIAGLGRDFQDPVVQAAVQGTFSALNRPGAGLRATLESGQTPLSFGGLQAAYQGLTNPDEYSTGKILQRQGVPDTPLPGFVGSRLGLSARDVAGGIGDLVADPLNFVPIGKLGSAAEIIGKGATRAAESDLARAGVGAGARFAAEDAGGLRIGRRAVEAVPEVVDEATNKLLDLVRQAKPAVAETKALRRAELRTRAGRVAAEMQGGSGEQAYLSARGQLRGELPKASFEPIRPALTQQDIDGFFNRIHAAPKLRPFDKIVTDTALTKVLAGELPQRNEIIALEKVFGPEFARELLRKRSKGEKISEFLLDAANVPRAIQSSWDASAPLRQGIMLSAGHPVAGVQALGPMFKAMFSEQAALAADDIIRSRPWAPLAEQAGLFRAPIEGVATELTAREEAFMSSLAQKIPILGRGIRGSERAYVTYLNKLRDDVFGNVTGGWTQEEATPDRLERLASFINVASGRGNIDAIADYAPALNAAFFSPRFFLSRLQATGQGLGAIADLGKSAVTRQAFDPVSKEIAKDTAAFFGTGMTVLGMLKASGAADVELDPRSSDFGKVRIGPTRYDFWAGNQQIARFVATLVSDERKSTRSGNLYPANRLETVGRFLQSKLAPGPGFLVDALRGETSQGDSVDLSEDSLRTQAFNRLVPFFVHDLIDSIHREGLVGGFKSLPGALGVGYQEYDAKSTALDKAAEAQFGRPFYSLEPFEKEAVKQANPELAQQLSDEAVAAGGSFGRSEELKRQFFSLQQASDARLTRGEISQSQWRDQYHDRQLELRSRRDEVMRAAGTGTQDQTLLGSYFKAIDAATLADGTVDWEAVDAWRAKLSSAEDASIDRNTGLGGTPRVQQHRATVRALAGSGFFDLRDGGWEATKQRYASRDELVNQSDSLEEFQRAWVERRTARLTPRYGEDVARQRAELEFQSSGIKQSLDKAAARNRKAWIQAHPDLARQAIAAGYLSPGRAVLNTLSRASAA